MNLSILDFSDLLSDVLALYESHGIQLTLDLKQSPMPVMGDATMLRQVLHNLLKNAQDALDGRPQPEIEIVLAVLDDQIHLEIADNGPGFSPDLLSRVFEPYVTTKRQGTGLGLAIVKKIVEEHRGTIHIENQARGGARIIVTLPLLEEQV